MRRLLLLSGLLLALSASYLFAQPAPAPPLSGTSPPSSVIGSALSSFVAKTRDPLSLTVSSFAALVSVGTLVYTMISKTRETTRSARSDFAEIIDSLVDLREKRDTLRRELGSDWGKSKTFETRAGLGDKQRSLVARAISLLHNHHIGASDIEYILVGASLADDGRYGDSLQYYKKAMEVSPSTLARASARRPYGRALILAGDVEHGREQLLSAAEEFNNLGNEAGLDGDRMKYLCAHVFRTMIWAEIQVGSKIHLEDDFGKLVALTASIKNRSDLGDTIEELKEVLPRLGIGRNQGSAQMAT